MRVCTEAGEVVAGCLQACAATIIGHRELRLALELASKAGSLDGLLSGLQGSAVLGIIVLTQSWPAGLLVDLLTEAAVMLCFDRIVARGGGLGPPFGMEPCVYSRPVHVLPPCVPRQQCTPALAFGCLVACVLRHAVVANRRCARLPVDCVSGFCAGRQC